LSRETSPPADRQILGFAALTNGCTRARSTGGNGS
jgi:hypothetical protein